MLHTMKERIFLYMMIIYSLGLSAQNNYADFLVQGTRTYWSLTKSVCHPQWNMIETGLCVGADSLFDWYKITDENDTLSLGEGSDWNINVDHRSFKLHEDTLFVMQWEIDGCCTHGHSYDTISYTINAYKIIYITKQKLLLLELKMDSLSRWVENTYPPCYELNILEYKCTKNEPNSP